MRNAHKEGEESGCVWIDGLGVASVGRESTKNNFSAHMHKGGRGEGGNGRVNELFFLFYLEMIAVGQGWGLCSVWECRSSSKGRGPGWSPEG